MRLNDYLFRVFNPHARIAPEEVAGAYERTGVTPKPHTWVSPTIGGDRLAWNGLEACGLGVMYLDRLGVEKFWSHVDNGVGAWLLEDITTSFNDEAGKAPESMTLRYGMSYTRGFVSGFDGAMNTCPKPTGPSENPANRWEEGYSDGYRARHLVEERQKAHQSREVAAQRAASRCGRVRYLQTPEAVRRHSRQATELTKV